MSLLVFIFYWIVIPILGLMVTLWLFSLAKSPLIRLLVVASFAAVLWGYSWMMWGEQAQVDKQVRELCAKDGGVKVYETVPLPSDKFNKWGQVNFFKPTQNEDSLGPDYVYKWEVHYYKNGDPASNGSQEIVMKRDQIRILRKSDMKLLGQVVMYERGGGDLPGPWMPSSFSCPASQEANEVILMSRIFIKSIEERKQ